MIIDCHGHYTTAPEPSTTSGARPRRPSSRPAATLIRPTRNLRRRDPQSRSRKPAACCRRARRGHDHLLAARLDHGPPRRQRGGSASLDPPLQRPDRSGSSTSIPRTSSASASCRNRRASPIEHSIGELERCVNELGFVGCNLNPDPSGGHWTVAAADRPLLVSRSTRRWSSSTCRR